MIIDNIKNIRSYSEIPEEAAEFLGVVNADVFSGRYDFSNRAFANVDEYDTKQFEDCKFEAHKKCIDIQMILRGEERLDYTPADVLKTAKPYSEENDVMFFENPEGTIDSVILTPGKFAFIFPHEAHKPQIAVNGKPEPVKKVVVKIRITG